MNYSNSYSFCIQINPIFESSVLRSTEKKLSICVWSCCNTIPQKKNKPPPQSGSESCPWGHSTPSWPSPRSLWSRTDSHWGLQHTWRCIKILVFFFGFLRNILNFEESYLKKFHFLPIRHNRRKFVFDTIIKGIIENRTLGCGLLIFVLLWSRFQAIACIPDHIACCSHSKCPKFRSWLHYWRFCN